MSASGKDMRGERRPPITSLAQWPACEETETREVIVPGAGDGAVQRATAGLGVATEAPGRVM